MKKGKTYFNYNLLSDNLMKYKIKNKSTYHELEKKCSLSHGFLACFFKKKYDSNVSIDNILSLCDMIGHNINKYIIK